MEDNYLRFLRGIYQNQAENQYYQAGVLFERLLGVSQEYSIGAGGWYRSKDAVSSYLKLGIKNLFIGFTYDITMSDLKAASGYNSMELSLQYIVSKRTKSPIVNFPGQ